MKYLLKKFRKSQTRFSRNSRKISLQSKRKGVVGVVLMREEKAISEKRTKIQVAPNCAALKILVFFFGGGYLYLDGRDLSY